MKSAIFLFLIAISTISCSSDSKTREPQKPRIDLFLGTWESEELTIRIHSAYGIEDSTLQIQANRSNWAEKMGLRPIITTFRADNTYSATYLEVDGTLRSESSGYFELISQDSLIIRRMKPSVETLRHAWIQKNDSIFGFSSVVDYDRDGQVDDELFALNRRIKR